MPTYTALHGFSLGPSRPNVAAGETLVTGVDISEAEGLSLVAGGQIALPSLGYTVPSIASVTKSASGYDERTAVPVEYVDGRSLGTVNVHGRSVSYSDPEEMTDKLESGGTLASLTPGMARAAGDDVITYPNSYIDITNGNNGAVSAVVSVWVRLTANSNRAVILNNLSPSYFGFSTVTDIAGSGIPSEAANIVGTGVEGDSHYLQMDAVATADATTKAVLMGSVNTNAEGPMLHPTGGFLQLVFTPSGGFEIDTVMAGYDSNDLDDVTGELSIDVGTGAGTLTVEGVGTMAGDTYYVEATYQVEA